MRKLIAPIFFACLFVTTSISGCNTLIPLTTPTPAATSIPMSISVSPFYNSQGTQIQVGNYSERLKTNDLQMLGTTAQEMSQKKEVLTPEQMYVLAIRLYDLGDKDNAVYWFYEAQFRAKLFQISLDTSHPGRVGEPSFELPVAYNDFTKLAGEYINGYAGCDIENWINIAKMVRDDNPKPPDLDKLFPDVSFVESSRWQSLNDQVGQGLDNLINYLSDNKETVKQQRKTRNLDAYCK